MRNLSIDDGASTMGGSKTEGMLTMMETTTESSWISDLPFSLQVEAKDLGDEDLGGYDDDDLDEFDDEEDDDEDDEEDDEDEDFDDDDDDFDDDDDDDLDDDDLDDD